MWQDWIRRKWEANRKEAGRNKERNRKEIGRKWEEMGREWEGNRKEIGRETLLASFPASLLPSVNQLVGVGG